MDGERDEASDWSGIVSPHPLSRVYLGHYVMHL